MWEQRVDRDGAQERRCDRERTLRPGGDVADGRCGAAGAFDPRSMVGASPEELLALKPSSWLVRPLPDGRPGFRMISPGKMPGAKGTVGYYASGAPDWVRFPGKPEPWLFVLNSVTEHHLLVEILAAGALPAESPGAAASDMPQLADATQRLIRDRLIHGFFTRRVRLFAVGGGLGAIWEPILFVFSCRSFQKSREDRHGGGRVERGSLVKGLLPALLQRRFSLDRIWSEMWV